MKLAKREEQIMHVCWTLKKAFIKEIIDELPPPRPHYNTIATMVKVLEEKGFLKHESVGNIFCYSPLISKEEYQDQEMRNFVRKYFDNSYLSMLTYFAKEQNISEDEFNEILTIIKSPKK